MNSYTDFLYARPSFFEGMGRVLDLGGTLNEYNNSLTPQQADAIALRMDWQAVGADMQAAMGQARRQVALMPRSRRRSKRNRRR